MSTIGPGNLSGLGAIAGSFRQPAEQVRSLDTQQRNTVPAVGVGDNTIEDTSKDRDADGHTPHGGGQPGGQREQESPSPPHRPSDPLGNRGGLLDLDA